MRIEHIIYLTSEEYHKLIQDSKSKNKNEFKLWLKKYTEIQTDFCVRVTDVNDKNEECYDFIVIDYDYSEN